MSLPSPLRAHFHNFYDVFTVDTVALPAPPYGCSGWRFQTRVFKGTGDATGIVPVDTEHYNTAEEAYEGHYYACRKFQRRPNPVP